MILDREIMACSLLKLAKSLKIEFAKTHFIQIISKINIDFENLVKEFFKIHGIAF